MPDLLLASSLTAISSFKESPTVTAQTASSAFLTKLEAKAILITNVPEEFHYERDPDDEMYINLAIVTNAGYLVSRDQDLLDLMTTSADIARQFRSRYPFLRIMTAADFITVVESATADR